MWRWVVGVSALLLAYGTTQASADTAREVVPSAPTGAHAALRVVVDNTGNRVGATAVHAGRRWQGWVRMDFDVSGGARPEFRAKVHRGRPGARYSRGDGSRWVCTRRRGASAERNRTTVVSAPRSCFDGAARMRVRVTVLAAGGARQTVVSRVVLQQSRPNIVVLMVDDMRADELRFMPWTRRLIGGQGVQFRNAFSTYPSCCPARASVLTGRYTHNHGVFSVSRPWGFTSFDDSSTVATWLARAGYANVYLGKYLNGYGWMPEPGAESGRSIHYVPPGWLDWRASIDGGLAVTHPKYGTTYRYFNTTLSRNGAGFDNYRGRYQTEVYGELSRQIIRARAASDKPFFLHASYTAPHTNGRLDESGPRVVRDDGIPIRFGAIARPESVAGLFDERIKAAPGSSWADPDLSDKPEYLRSLPPLNEAERLAILELARQRAEALHVVDQQVRRTVNALAASGELEETLLLFTSDNGYFLGEQRMRKGKVLPHEPSLRIPLLVRGPGIPAGRVRSDPFMLVDVAPTLAAAAGVRPAAPVDGMSMLPVARDGDRGWTRPVLTETGPRSVIVDADESGLPIDASDPGGRNIRWAIGIRTARYLYVDIATGEEELYDIANDPQQYHNLAGRPEHAEVLETLRRVLRRTQACDGVECRRTLPLALSTAVSR